MHLKEIKFLYIIIFFVFYSYSADTSIASVEIPVDGANAAVTFIHSPYTLQTIHCAYNSRPSTSLTLVKDIDAFLNYCAAGDRSYMDIITILGSETGEPLFSSLTGDSVFNREHLTYGAVMGSLPKKQLSFTASYRHNGHYSDSFERYALQYNKRYKQSLKYCNIGDYGLSNHIVFAWKGMFEKVNLYGDVNRLQHWDISPVYYTPIFNESYSSFNSLSFPLNKSTVYINFLADKRKMWCYNNDGKDRSSFNAYFGANRLFFGKIKGELQFKTSTDSTEKVSIQSSITDTTKAFLQWKFNGSINNLGKPSFLFWVKSEKSDIFSFKTEFTRKFHTSGREFSFQTLNDTVTYSPKDYYSTSLFSSLSIYQKKQIKTQSTIWCILELDPFLPAIDSSYEKTQITYHTFSPPAVIMGGEASVFLKRKFISANFDFSFRQVLRGIQPHIFFPWSGNLKITIHPFGEDKLNFSTELKTFSSVTYNRYSKNSQKIISIESKETAGLFVYTAIPFMSPLFRRKIKPRINITAGPIFLIGSNRQYFHPLSSPMGPMVKLEFVLGIL